MPLVRKTAPTADEYVSEDSLFENEDENEIAPVSASLQAGWDAADQLANSSRGSSQYTNNIKFSDDPKLIAFINGAPVDAYEQHWVTRKGAQSFRCLGDSCPLCAAGDRPSARFVFFVLEFIFEGDKVDTQPMLWTCGRRVFEQLKAINADPRKGGPLEGHFFTVHRIGSGPDTQYVVQPQKPRDLEEDPWGLPADGALEAVRDAQANAAPSIYVAPAETLEQVASELRRSS